MVREATKIAAVYLIVGISWIFFSDRLAISNSAYFQTVKGISYVSITALLLWFYIRRMEQKNRQILDNLEKSLSEVKRTKNRLHAKRTLLRTVIDHVPDYIHAKDLNGKIIVMNKPMLNLLGISSERDAKSISANSFFPSESDSDFFRSAEVHVLQTGEPLVNLEHFSFNDGKTHRLLTAIVPLLDADQKVSGLASISRDISELYNKRLKDDLIYKIIDSLGKNRKLSVGLATTLELIAAHFNFLLAEAWLVSDVTNELILEATWALSKRSGFHENHKKQYAPNEGLPGLTYSSQTVQIWENIMQHPDFTRAHLLDDEVLNTGIGIPLVLDGEVIAVFTFLARERFYDHEELKAVLEKFSMQIVMHLNRKKHERLLAESNDEITKLLETINDGFFTVREDWTVTYWNKVAEDLLGMPKQAIVGQNLWEKFPTALKFRFFEEYSKVMSTGTAASFDEYFRTTDQWFAVNAYPTKTGISVFFRDITQTKRMSAEIEQRVEELAVSNAELEQFAYIASHDLQEPLRMVTGFLSQLEKKYNDLLDDRGKQYIHFAVDGATRMRRLILDLLEYSKVGKTGFHPEKINIKHLVDEIIIANQLLIDEQKATITTGNLPEITAGHILMQQLFQNLITNSIKYRQEADPEIFIDSSDHDNYWEFSVRDNGIGINSDYFEKVFVIFQRLHSKEQYSGTGIGLAICKKIVESHGGRIWIESEEGKGSTFYFTIKK